MDLPIRILLDSVEGYDILKKQTSDENVGIWMQADSWKGELP